MPHVNRDGLSLYYEQEGHADPPLVFIHGWCCDHTFFQPQFDHFKKAHTVTALDLRGCGNSAQPEYGYDIPVLADDVAWLCRELGLSKPIFVGHSLGGMIGIELAARYPSLPTAIIAVDPGPIDPLPQTSRLFEGFVAQLQGPAGDAVRRAYIQDMFLATDDTDRKRWIVETMCSVPQRVAVAVIRGILAWNGVGALLLCNAPLLVLRSQPGGSNAPARLQALKPDVHIGVTVGSGHFHQLEVPEQVTPMIERFIQLVSGPSAPAALHCLQRTRL
jgi:pimeloyl-ACP methyl ester carboxylesterase